MPRRFPHSLFQRRFTTPGTQCAAGFASRKLSPCSLGCRRTRIMGILAKVFTTNVDFSRSHCRAFNAKRRFIVVSVQVARLSPSPRAEAPKWEFPPFGGTQLSHNFRFVASGPARRGAANRKVDSRLSEQVVILAMARMCHNWRIMRRKFRENANLSTQHGGNALPFLSIHSRASQLLSF